MTLKTPANSSRHHLQEWIAAAARRGPADGSWRVLDAGAGEAPYRGLFAHVKYETADFGQVDKPYGDLDYVCDLTDLPMSDGTYDQVVCSQVLEHLPEPTAALREFHRVLKPGGEAWVSAPLFYEEHEQPHDYHRYTQFAWRRMAAEAGFEVRELEWLEGYHGTLAYQLLMAARNLRGLHLVPVRALFLLLAHYFARSDVRQRITDRGMPKNYRCVLVKPV